MGRAAPLTGTGVPLRQRGQCVGCHQPGRLRTGNTAGIQDGSGVDKLTAEQRERYLQASADCQSSAPASGIVYELFVAGKGKTFTAKPKPDAEIASLLAKRSSCGKDTLYFSLRYLPVAHGILEY